MFQRMPGCEYGPNSWYKFFLIADKSYLFLQRKQIIPCYPNCNIK
jgi:hypothetical protein